MECPWKTSLQRSSIAQLCQSPTSRPGRRSAALTWCFLSLVFPAPHLSLDQTSQCTKVSTGRPQVIAQSRRARLLIKNTVHPSPSGWPSRSVASATHTDPILSTRSDWSPSPTTPRSRVTPCPTRPPLTDLLSGGCQRVLRSQCPLFRWSVCPSRNQMTFELSSKMFRLKNGKYCAWMCLTVIKRV